MRKRANHAAETCGRRAKRAETCETGPVKRNETGEEQWNRAPSKARKFIRLVAEEGWHEQEAAKASLYKASGESGPRMISKRWEKAIQYRRVLFLEGKDAAGEARREALLEPVSTAREETIARLRNLGNVSVKRVVGILSPENQGLIKKLDEEAARTIAKLKFANGELVEVAFWPPTPALATLSKVLGLYAPTVVIPLELSDEGRIGLEAALAEVRKGSG